MPRPELAQTSLNTNNKRSLQYSLLLHVGIVVAAIILGSLHRLPDVEPPRVVEAVLVSASTLPRPAPAKPISEPTPIPEPEPKPVKTPEPVTPTIKPVEKPLPATLPKVALPPEKPVIKPIPTKPVPTKPALNRSALDAEMRALERDMQRELTAQQMKAEAEQAQRAAANAAATARDAANQALREKHERLIRQRVITKWNRPLSARRGMVTTLRITVLPGGEVSNVVTVKSSGDPAFDASAEEAVRRSSPLPGAR
jgi:colicin import membrane protein